MFALSAFDHEKHKQFMKSLQSEFAVSKHCGFATIKSSNGISLKFSSASGLYKILVSNKLTYHMSGNIEYHTIDKNTLLKLLLMDTLEQIKYLHNVYCQ